ncbi:hypothetical protein [Mesorhizobium jarvisii]|uniref:hypothetical protein n=1 Tax=Mesorhizobium jarvisii TaxID=1777867 RepID=UPI001F0B17A9|nr:hypothetical protein [Mesorhizobium jarvisii]MCH4561434.1 hypothetical protein [Mesorhizobium jarvisii]
MVSSATIRLLVIAVSIAIAAKYACGQFVGQKAPHTLFKMAVMWLWGLACSQELCWNLGDEADQAALCGFNSMTSIPSWNLAPAMSFGN